jgi:hypothetical protein
MSVMFCTPIIANNSQTNDFPPPVGIIVTWSWFKRFLSQLYCPGRKLLTARSYRCTRRSISAPAGIEHCGKGTLQSRAFRCRISLIHWISRSDSSPIAKSCDIVRYFPDQPACTIPILIPNRSSCFIRRDALSGRCPHAHSDNSCGDL